MGNQGSCIAECFFVITLPLCAVCIDECIKHGGNHCPKNVFGGGFLQQAQERQMDINEIHQQWANIHTVYSPDTICKSLGGATHDASVCDIDFSRVESSGFLNFLDGIKTSGELCGAIQGSYGGLTCTVNLQGAGTATVEDKKVACGELKGEWKEDKCVIERLEV